jgi:hypothetical protein
MRTFYRPWSRDDVASVVGELVHSAVWKVADLPFQFVKGSDGWRIGMGPTETDSSFDHLRENGLYHARFKTRREAVAALELALSWSSTGADEPRSARG